MEETTGGGSGGSSGAGGSQVENLVIGAKTDGVQQAEQDLDKLGTTVLRSAESIDGLSKSLNENAQWVQKSNDKWAQLNAQANAAYEAQQQAAKALAEQNDQAERFNEKLVKMTETFGMSKAELLAYEAAERGVLDTTIDMIDKLDRLTQSQQQNAIQQQRDIQLYNEQTQAAARLQQIQEQRDMWEHNQRAQNYADYANWWNRTLATEEANNAKLLAEEQRRVDREKQIQQERDVWLNNQRQKQNADYASWWEQQLKSQDAAQERALKLDADYSSKTAHQREELLRRIRSYQDAGMSESTLTNMFGSKAVAAAGEFEGALKGLGAALDNNRVRSEALVLAHEALQGRFTRMPGSLMVMGEYLTSSGIEIGAFALGFAAAAAAVAAFAYEVSKGYEEQKHLEDSLIRTNGYAGVTAGSLDVLAHSMGDVNGQYKESYEAVTQLTASGKFTADQISTISSTVVALNHSMGTDLNQTIKEFETLTVKATTNGAKGGLEISKAIETLDQKYHFLNASILEEIVALEKEGKAREAQQLAVQTYADSTKKAAEQSEENIGWIEHSWDKVTAAIKRVGQEMADLGKTNLETRAAKMREALNSALPSFNILSAHGGFETDESKLTRGQIAMLHDYYDLLKQIDEKKAQAAKDSAERTKQSDADHAIIQRSIEDRSLMKKSDNELADALEKNLEQLNKVTAANPAYLDDPKNVQYEQERAMAIVKAHTQKTSKAKNDGRKQDLQDQLAADKQAYREAQEAADNDITQAKQLADAKKISRQEEYDDITTAYNMQLKALQKSEADQLATLYAYQPLNDVDAREKIKRIHDVVREYQLGSKEIANALSQAQEGIVDKSVKQAATTDKKELDDLDRKIRDQTRYNAEIGKTADMKKVADSDLQKSALIQDQLDAAYQHSIADNQDLGTVERAVAAQRAKDLDEAIAKRKQYDQLLQDAAKLEAQSIADKAWAASAKKFENDLESAIVDGGGRGWKKLIRDMELGFAKLILQPILQPISAGFASIMYPTATQAGGTASVGGASALGQGISLAQTAATAYKAISGGVAGFTSTIGGGITAVGNAVGSSNIAAFGSGFSMSGMGGTTAADAAAAYNAAGMTSTGSSITAGATVGTIATVAAGIAAGLWGGHAISNGYSIGGSVNAAPIAGTAVGGTIGAVVGGPIGAAIGSAIGGVLGGITNRLFGMGETELKSQGIQGTISASGTTGVNYKNYHQDGGVFRSDKNWTETPALDSAVSSQLTNGFVQLEQTTLSLAKSLDISSSALDGYTKSFDIKMTGDATKDQQAMTDFFTALGNELSDHLIPGLSQFALVGETAAQTLQRLSGDFDATNQAAKALGVSAEKMFGSLDVNSTEARERLINYSGGTSNVTSQAQFFEQNFLTQAQQLAPVATALNTALEGLGLTTIPQTREEFAKLVEDLITSGAVATDAGAKEYASLMALADAFATVHAADASMMLTADQARTQLSNSYKTEADAINQANTSMKTFSQTLKQLRNSSVLGNLSPLTPEQKYQQAKQQYDAIVASIKNGDSDAQSQYEQAYNNFLTASQTVNASGDQYQQDFQYAQDMTDQIGKWADQQVSVGEQTLDALNKQINGLVDINDSTLTVTAAIYQLAGAMGVDAKTISGNDSAIKSLYENIVGNDPTDSQMTFWEQRLNGGQTINQIAQAISQSGGDTGKVAPLSQISPVASNLTNADVGQVVTALHNVQNRIDLLRAENAQQAAFVATAQDASAQESAQTIADATTSAVANVQQRIQPS